MDNRQDHEAQRLRQLRDRQLQARDPLKKERKKQQHISRMYQGRKKYTLADGAADLSHKVKGLFIGAAIGIVVAILLLAFVQAAWVELVALMAVIALSIFGFVVGSSFDWRDDLRDL